MEGFVEMLDGSVPQVVDHPTRPGSGEWTCVVGQSADGNGMVRGWSTTRHVGAVVDQPRPRAGRARRRDQVLEPSGGASVLSGAEPPPWAATPQSLPSVYAVMDSDP